MKVGSLARIFVYGGCVTRDAFEHMKDEHGLGQYVARQSLISAASAPLININTDVLTTNFQHRSVKGDLHSSLHPLIIDQGPTTDLFLFDILSERLGVYRVPGKRYITKSVELSKTGLTKTIPGGAVTIRFGTDEHYALWKLAADKFIRKLKLAGIFDRTLLFEAPWTDVTDTGAPVPRYRNIDADTANTRYTRYYAFLRKRGVRTSTIPSELAVSSEKHKWGPAPYHYVDEAYLWMKQEALKVLEEQAL
jgi:hypothetical protein